MATIREELLAIQASNTDNILHPREALDWARDHPSSALHGALEWDNDKAAEEYRLGQIRNLVRLHVITEEGGPQLVSLSFDRTNGGGYRAIDDVTKVPDLREIMLQDALNELDRVQRKYARVQALSKVWNEVEAAKKGRKGPVAKKTSVA